MKRILVVILLLCAVRANAQTTTQRFTKVVITSNASDALVVTGDVIASHVTASFIGSLMGAVIGNVTGNLTGNVTGNVTGNASTATALVTPRAINGVNFDGSAPITVTAAASTLTGTTLASGVVTSSLTALATINSFQATTAGVRTAPVSGISLTVDGDDFAQLRLTSPLAAGAQGITFLSPGGSGLQIYAQAPTGGASSRADFYSGFAKTFTLQPNAASVTGTLDVSGNITGTLIGAASSAAVWTTPRNLGGNSVNGSANVAFANKFVVQGTTDSGLSAAQFLGALSTGIVKNTTTTGVLSIAIAADFPTLNQSTTGSAATLTTPRAINGTNFDGSAPITVTAAAGTLTGTTLNSTVTASSLTSFGASPTLTTPTIASFTNATHNHSNAAGGGTIAESVITFTDITTNNVSTSSHGYMSKLPGGTSTFYRADGTFASPSVTVNDSDVVFTDITTGNATTTKHGYLPKLPGTTTTVLNGNGAFVTPMCQSDICTYSFPSTFSGVSDGVWRFRTSGGAGSGFSLRANTASVVDILNDGASNYGGINLASIRLAGNMVFGTPAYSAGAGFGSSPSINGASSGAFAVTIGTSPTTTGVVSGLPTVPTGWSVACSDKTSTDSIVVDQSAGTTQSVTLKFYARTTGVATAPTAGDVITCVAWGY